MNQTTFTLRKRIGILRWVLPVILGVLAVFYEIGPGRWIHDQYSVFAYFDLDIVFYGLIIPLVTFASLTLLSRWLDEKERAEWQARASELRLASIMAASADAIVSLDSAGCIQSWNRGAELLFGYHAYQILEKSLSVLLGNSEAAEAEMRWLVENVRQMGFIRGHETTCLDSVGRAVIVEITATHLTDDREQSLGMSVILRNVTERKHRESEIRQLNIDLKEEVAERTHELAEKVEQLARANADLQKLDQMRTEFMSVVAHQIRAPLTNMRGAFERMEGNCPAVNGICSRMFTILDQQAVRLDRLVKDVLNASRIESGDLILQPEPVSVQPIVQQVVEQIRTRTVNRPFQVLIKPGLPLIFADRYHVAEILANLLDNADKYAPPGSEVLIETRADQTEVTISVCDHGPGLPSASLERIFEKFYRTDSSDSQMAYGYGLGLYVCRQLVEAQGGHIWAENVEGGGLVFSFSLPVAA